MISSLPLSTLFRLNLCLFVGTDLTVSFLAYPFTGHRFDDTSILRTAAWHFFLLHSFINFLNNMNIKKDMLSQVRFFDWPLHVSKREEDLTLLLLVR